MAGRVLDANGIDRPTAQTFEAERARAGEQFEHPASGDTSAQAVEDGLLDQVGSGTDCQAPGRLDDSPCGLAAGNSHGGMKPRMTSPGNLETQNLEACTLN